MPFCSSCGAKNPDGAKFCAGCGQPLSAPAPAPAAAPPKASTAQPPKAPTAQQVAARPKPAVQAPPEEEFSTEPQMNAAKPPAPAARPAPAAHPAPAAKAPAAVPPGKPVTAKQALHSETPQPKPGVRNEPDPNAPNQTQFFMAAAKVTTGHKVMKVVIFFVVAIAIGIGLFFGLRYAMEAKEQNLKMDKPAVDEPSGDQQPGGGQEQPAPGSGAVQPPTAPTGEQAKPPDEAKPSDPVKPAEPDKPADTAKPAEPAKPDNGATKPKKGK